jgi:hypothetical protein
MFVSLDQTRQSIEQYREQWLESSGRMHFKEKYIEINNFRSKREVRVDQARFRAKLGSITGIGLGTYLQLRGLNKTTELLINKVICFSGLAYAHLTTDCSFWNRPGLRLLGEFFATQVTWVGPHRLSFMHLILLLCLWLDGIVLFPISRSGSNPLDSHACRSTSDSHLSESAS